MNSSFLYTQGMREGGGGHVRPVVAKFFIRLALPSFAFISPGSIPLPALSLRVVNARVYAFTIKRITALSLRLTPASLSST